MRSRPSPNEFDARLELGAAPWHVMGVALMGVGAVTFSLIADLPVAVRLLLAAAAVWMAWRSLLRDALRWTPGSVVGVRFPTRIGSGNAGAVELKFLSPPRWQRARIDAGYVAESWVVVSLVLSRGNRIGLVISGDGVTDPESFRRFRRVALEALDRGPGREPAPEWRPAVPR